jgi:hypothetical protein
VLGESVRTVWPVEHEKQLSLLHTKNEQQQVMLENLLVYLKYKIECHLIKVTWKRSGHFIREAEVEQADAVRLTDFSSQKIVLTTARGIQEHRELHFHKTAAIYKVRLNHLMSRGPMATSDEYRTLTNLAPRQWTRHGAVLYCFVDDPCMARYAEEVVNVPGVCFPGEVVGLILAYVCRNSPEGTYSLPRDTCQDNYQYTLTRV